MTGSLVSTQSISAVNDLLDNCAQVQRDQRVIILGSLDGLSGGVNLVAEEVLMWLHSGVVARGGHSTIIWTELNARTGPPRVPPIIKAALKEANDTLPKLRNLKGGITEWMRKGQEVEKD